MLISDILTFFMELDSIFSFNFSTKAPDEIIDTVSSNFWKEIYFQRCNLKRNYNLYPNLYVVSKKYRHFLSRGVATSTTLIALLQIDSNFPLLIVARYITRNTCGKIWNFVQKTSNFSIASQDLNGFEFWHRVRRHLLSIWWKHA